MEENVSSSVPDNNVQNAVETQPLSENTTFSVNSNETIHSNDATDVSTAALLVEPTKDTQETKTELEKEVKLNETQSEIKKADEAACTMIVEVTDTHKEVSEKILAKDTSLDHNEFTDTIDKLEKPLIEVENSVSSCDQEQPDNGQVTELHNKSLSREFKSLMKTAQESKIINECTQVTTKMRKSKPKDQNTTEPMSRKGSRRSSENSQRSNSSEKSDRISQKRSMRSQNPEFVSKQKQFLHSVTGKPPKEKENREKSFSHSESESGDETKTTPIYNKRFESMPKRQRKASENQSSGIKSDPYCWRCHWPVSNNSNEKTATQPPAHCTICPRSYHYKCLSHTERAKYTAERDENKNWACIECVNTVRAESLDTRSPVLSKMSLTSLQLLLKHALDRMMQLNGVEPFIHPVDHKAFPDYNKYVVYPMDLTRMGKKIEDKGYGSTDAFIADVQWILHNSIIFNTVQSKLTVAARLLVRTCRTEMWEIETCPECYAAAHERRPTWFTDVCSTPHILIWAKLKGFPFWPAKGMSVNASGMVDVRFFGAHDRAWVPARDCYLYCDRDPNNFKARRQDIIDSMQEAELHIRNIDRKFKGFVYAPFKTPLDITEWNKQLKMMIPGLQGDLRLPLKATKEKNNISSTSSPSIKEVRQRSSSKSSKEFLMDGDASEDDETTKTRKMADGGEIAREDEDKDTTKDQSEEVDVITLESSNQGRKRRRSALEEAVLTVMETPEKQKRLDPHSPKSGALEEKEIINSTHGKNDKQEMDVDETVNVQGTKVVDESKKIDETNEGQVKMDISQNVSVNITKDKSTSENKNPSKITDSNKGANKSKSSGNIKPTYGDKDKSINAKLKSTPQKEKILTNRSKVRSSRDDKNKSRLSHKSDTSSKTSSAVDKDSSKKNVSHTQNTSSPTVKSTNTISINLTDSPDKNESPKEKPTPMSTSTPNNSHISSSISVKDRIFFDDNTTLAELARNNNKSQVIVDFPCLPTISSIQSLSQCVDSVTKKTRTTTQPDTKVSSTIKKDNRGASASKADEAKKDVENPSVGRVGVRAFARMTSPENKQRSTPTTTTTDKDPIEVEIKAEPADDDADRQTEKLNLMNVFSLRPVTQTTTSSLRDVRIKTPTVVISNVRKGQPKPAEVRPRAKKTFPQPRKPEDGRSELNSKNCMVYIPIQPAANQAPARGAPHSRANGPPSTSKSNATIVSSSTNVMVNTVTTPLMQVACLQPSGSAGAGPSTGGVGSSPGSGNSHAVAPTVGSVPTNVHTVPLITSVNGQWTFSLQPIMSVGSNSNEASIMVNGVTERPKQLPAPALPALPAPSTQPPRTNTDSVTQNDMPRLQQRPLLNPLDPSTPVSTDVPTPSAVGAVSAKLNKNAGKLADFFRNLIEDSLEKLNEPEAQLTLLKLQLERERWKHQQEIAEIKCIHEMQFSEMQKSLEKEKARVASETRRVCQAELESAVNHAKSRQWCANCGQEAQFYCCFNTSYCDYQCQLAHWNRHFPACTQRSQQGGESKFASASNNIQPQASESTASSSDAPVSTSTSAAAPALTVGGKTVPSRVYTSHSAQTKQSIIVSMIDDSGSSQSMKCIGTYKTSTGVQSSGPLLLNKQIMSTEESTKKVMPPGGYIIVNAPGSNSLLLN